MREERSATGAVAAAGTYSERVWYRAGDGAALARRIEGGFVTGPMVVERPTLDGDVDPGPPTADIFAPGAPSALATPVARDASTLPVLASVSVRGEFDYRASFESAASDDGFRRLRLEPRRDPERNRLRELAIDARTDDVRRFVMRDRIYFASRTNDVPDTFAFVEGVTDGVPSIVSAASVPRADGAPGDATAPSLRYRFEDVEFPATLPDWYFDGYVLAKHAREAPNR